MLSGLPFSRKLTKKILSIQKNIDEIISDTKHYWVKENNLGLEYCVFKWPDDNISKINLDEIKGFVSNLKIPKFKVLFDGCQLNPDGCIVIKGFDISSNIDNLRNLISKNISNLPSKQSNWYHIPIGRILEPVGVERFLKLKFFFNSNDCKWGHLEEIKNIKLIHEYQWYMERRRTLMKINNK